MGKSKIQVLIKDYQKTQKELDQLKKVPKAVLERTVSDMRTRAPGWIASEVTKVYGVSKSELKPGTKSIGTIRVSGSKTDNVRIIYRGRVLTPTHFGMTPTSPKQAYTLKAGIFKGQKTQLGKVKKLTKKQRRILAKNFRGEGTQSSDHSPIMLMSTGNAREGGINYIPFQRTSRDRNDIKAIKTVSLPQMVSSERVSPGISRVLNENLEKRLEHHMKLLGR